MSSWDRYSTWRRKAGCLALAILRSVREVVQTAALPQCKLFNLHDFVSSLALHCLVTDYSTSTTDGLSGAASGMAVASLALQLGGTIKTVYNLWQSMNEASSSLAAIAADLEMFLAVLSGISAHYEIYGADRVTTSILEGCMI
jgi:hypothetical protein